MLCIAVLSCLCFAGCPAGPPLIACPGCARQVLSVLLCALEAPVAAPLPVHHGLMHVCAQHQGAVKPFCHDSLSMLHVPFALAGGASQIVFGDEDKGKVSLAASLRGSPLCCANAVLYSCVLYAA